MSLSVATPRALNPGISASVAGVAADEVSAQVDRIGRSEGFRKSERLRRFLQFTVDRTLRGDVWQLREHVIAREVFDRPADFDPRVESIVRVEAKRLRRKLTDYYTVNGGNDSIVIEFRTGSYVPEIRENQLRAIHRPRTSDLSYGAPDGESYARYLEAAEELSVPNTKHAALAVERFLLLTTEQPGFALAQSGLAEAYVNQAMLGSRTPLQALDAAQVAARRSADLDPTLPQASAALARVRLFVAGDGETAMEFANRAIERMPHCVGAHVTRGLALLVSRRELEALGALQRAVELGTFSARANLALAIAYDSADRPVEAERWYRAADALHPNGFTRLLWSLHALGRKKPAEALQHIREYADGSSSAVALGITGAAAAASGDRKSALRMLTRLNDQFEGGYSDPLGSALVHLFLGEEAQASVRLRASLDQRSPLALLASTLPMLRGVLARTRPV
jgi:tetratricopeptide (TPR) repeat protein